MKEKSFSHWTRKDFEMLPDISTLAEKPAEAASLVILPTKQAHDSGYRILNFAVIVNNKPICKIVGCFDLLRLGSSDGLHGGRLPKPYKPVGWNIDCLATSGLLRIFCDMPLVLTPQMSTFDMYYIEPKNYAYKPRTRHVDK